ncbi:hypothetical protein D3C76_1333010 [compost metagenome]
MKVMKNIHSAIIWDSVWFPCQINLITSMTNKMKENAAKIIQAKLDTGLSEPLIIPVTNVFSSPLNTLRMESDRAASAGGISSNGDRNTANMPRARAITWRFLSLKSPTL